MKYDLKNIIIRFQKKERVKFLFFWGHTVKDEITKSCFSQWFPWKLNKLIIPKEKHLLFDDEKLNEKLRLYQN